MPGREVDPVRRARRRGGRSPRRDRRRGRASSPPRCPTPTLRRRRGPGEPEAANGAAPSAAMPGDREPGRAAAGGEDQPARRAGMRRDDAERAEPLGGGEQRRDRRAAAMPDVAQRRLRSRAPRGAAASPRAAAAAHCSTRSAMSAKSPSAGSVRLPRPEEAADDLERGRRRQGARARAPRAAPRAGGPGSAYISGSVAPSSRTQIRASRVGVGKRLALGPPRRPPPRPEAPRSRSRRRHPPAFRRATPGFPAAARPRPTDTGPRRALAKAPVRRCYARGTARTANTAPGPGAREPEASPKPPSRPGRAAPEGTRRNAPRPRNCGRGGCRVGSAGASKRLWSGHCSGRNLLGSYRPPRRPAQGRHRCYARAHRSEPLDPSHPTKAPNERPSKQAGQRRPAC